MPEMEMEPVVVGDRQWEQDTPVGGDDRDGNPPEEAREVLVVGIVTVRNVPTLHGAANSYPAAVATAVPVVGRTPQRRAITIIADVAGRLNVSKDAVQGGTGLIIPANTPVVLQTAEQLWFFNTTAGAGNVSFFAEIDRG